MEMYCYTVTVVIAVYAMHMFEYKYFLLWFLYSLLECSEQQNYMTFHVW